MAIRHVSARGETPDKSDMGATWACWDHIWVYGLQYDILCLTGPVPVPQCFSRWYGMVRRWSIGFDGLYGLQLVPEQTLLFSHFHQKNGAEVDFLRLIHRIMLSRPDLVSWTSGRAWLCQFREVRRSHLLWGQSWLAVLLELRMTIFRLMPKLVHPMPVTRRLQDNSFSVIAHLFYTWVLYLTCNIGRLTMYSS